MKLIIKKGTTSKTQKIFITDSSKTDGSGLTGLVHNTTSLTAYYIREDEASATAITLVTATVGTYIEGGFIEVDTTNLPGIYEFHLPDACLVAGADSVLIFLKGAADMAPLPLELQLDKHTTEDICGAGFELETDSLRNIEANMELLLQITQGPPYPV